MDKKYAVILESDITGVALFFEGSSLPMCKEKCNRWAKKEGIRLNRRPKHNYIQPNDRTEVVWTTPDYLMDRDGGRML